VGGYLEVDERAEAAVRREVREETGLMLTDVRLFPKIYDDPRRDPRRHAVSLVFVARAVGTPQPGDDAAGTVVVPLADLPRLAADGRSFAFDHGEIFLDYLASAMASPPAARSGE
ncbi:unnamed protein product, partial [Phaeothamnion confervicola]